MPYCAPSENGTQCHTCSREPFARGSRLPAQPGISSLVRRGARRGLFSRYLTLFIVPPHFGACGTQTGIRGRGSIGRRPVSQAQRAGELPCIKFGFELGVGNSEAAESSPA